MDSIKYDFAPRNKNAVEIDLLQTYYCCDRKSRGACAQSFALRQQATIETMRRNLSYYCLLAPRNYIFVLRADPVHGESHNQRNATREVATLSIFL